MRKGLARLNLDLNLNSNPRALIRCCGGERAGKCRGRVGTESGNPLSAAAGLFPSRIGLSAFECSAVFYLCIRLRANFLLMVKFRALRQKWGRLAHRFHASFNLDFSFYLLNSRF